jgi:hypothetical protein
MRCESRGSGRLDRTSVNVPYNPGAHSCRCGQSRKVHHSGQQTLKLSTRGMQSSGTEINHHQMNPHSAIKTKDLFFRQTAGTSANVLICIAGIIVELQVGSVTFSISRVIRVFLKATCATFSREGRITCRPCGGASKRSKQNLLELDRQLHSVSRADRECIPASQRGGWTRRLPASQRGGGTQTLT